MEQGFQPCISEVLGRDGFQPPRYAMRPQAQNDSGAEALMFLARSCRPEGLKACSTRSSIMQPAGEFFTTLELIQLISKTSWFERYRRNGEFFADVAFISGLSVDSDNRIRGVTDVRSISKSIALLCLVLTFWSAIAFAVHQHSDATEAAKCTVCVAAHSASPKTPSIVVHTTFVAVATFRAEPVSAKQRLVAFALTVRPPPEV